MSSKDAVSVRIVVDVHETKSGIAEMLAELGASVERAALAAGDYAVGADTLIERKRVLDLHGAVLKGRLWPQLGKLRATCAFPYLLLEGTDVDRGPLHPNAVRGTCLAVIDQGIALLRSDHQRDSARWIHRLAIRCQRVDGSTTLGRARNLGRLGSRTSFAPCKAHAKRAPSEEARI
jgi:ERCC4-type nuclease